MLSCHQLTNKAPDYLDKQLPWMQTLEIKFHLAICPNCRRYMSQSAQAFKFIPKQRDDQTREIPDEVLQGLLSQLNQRDDNS